MRIVWTHFIRYIFFQKHKSVENWSFFLSFFTIHWEPMLVRRHFWPTQLEPKIYNMGPMSWWGTGAQAQTVCYSMRGQEMLEDSEVRGVNTNYVEQDCHFSMIVRKQDWLWYVMTRILFLCKWTKLETTSMITNTKICISYTLLMNIHHKSTLSHFHLFRIYMFFKNHTYLDISNCNSDIVFILYFSLSTYSLPYLRNLTLITTELIRYNWSPFAALDPLHV